MSGILENIRKRFAVSIRFDRALLTRVLIFFVLCQLMAFVIAMFISMGDRNAPFAGILAMTEITAMCIGPLVAASAALTINFWLERFTPIPGFVFFLCITMSATLIGIGLCWLTSWVFLPGGDGAFYRGELPIIGLSAGLVTITTTIVSFVLHRGKAAAAREAAASAAADAKADAAASTPVESVVFRADDGHRRVAIRDIIYLSAAGEKTVVHTPGEDIVISRYLGQLAETIPEPIIRCHRSFAFNRDWCVRIVGAAGGRYTVFLRDDDETNLPVGRSYAAAVKAMLGVNRDEQDAPPESQD